MVKLKLRRIEMINLMSPRYENGEVFWQSIRALTAPEHWCWTIRMVACGVDGYRYQNDRAFKREVLREMKRKAVESYEGERKAWT